jgi:hypothetical protein
MFDNLRQEAGFIEDEEPADDVQVGTGKKQRPARPVSRRRRTFDQITGTTPFQRFILACMLFMTVCLLGVALLLFTGKIDLSFLYY